MQLTDTQPRPAVLHTSRAGRLVYCGLGIYLIQLCDPASDRVYEQYAQRMIRFAGEGGVWIGASYDSGLESHEYQY